MIQRLPRTRAIKLKFGVGVGGGAGGQIGARARHMSKISDDTQMDDGDEAYEYSDDEYHYDDDDADGNEQKGDEGPVESPPAGPAGSPVIARVRAAALNALPPRPPLPSALLPHTRPPGVVLSMMGRPR